MAKIITNLFDELHGLLKRRRNFTSVDECAEYLQKNLTNKKFNTITVQYPCTNSYGTQQLTSEGYGIYYPTMCIEDGRGIVLAKIFVETKYNRVSDQEMVNAIHIMQELVKGQQCADGLVILVSGCISRWGEKNCFTLAPELTLPNQKQIKLNGLCWDGDNDFTNSAKRKFVIFTVRDDYM